MPTLPLWAALLLGVLLWTPVAFGLACLVGHCIKRMELEEPKPDLLESAQQEEQHAVEVLWRAQPMRPGCEACGLTLPVGADWCPACGEMQGKGRVA